MDPVDILLVDDTPANLMAIESVLAELGQNIIKANSGREALKILLERDFALILLDINMPGMDGFETASLIRQRKNSELTPIIFITAYGSSETHRNLGYSLGAVDYIFSPIIPEILKSKASVFVELYKKTLQIQQLHEALKAHAKALEARVEERTAELSQANQELIRLNKIKSDFTSMVTHELRTPLAAIKEGIGLVLEGVDGPVTEAQIETLTISKKNVDRLAKLIQNVLNLSQFESGKIQMVFDKNNLNALVREIFNLMTPLAQKKGIRLSLNLPKKDVYALCDTDQIKQVIINLLDNAIKFTDANRATGEVVVTLSEKSGRLSLEVADTGMGIPREDCDKIFDMYTQVRSQGGRKTGGVGIGLAVCRKIAEFHHGTLTVKSKIGVGTQFLFEFPTKP
jgi:signal transduction histidine kinase